MQEQDGKTITELLGSFEQGEAGAAEQLLPLVYSQLRDIAEGMIRRERPGQTLQATALVHEAYLRLAGVDDNWESQRHYFNTAALIMRHVMIDRSRKRNAEVHGGKINRVQVHADEIPASTEYTPQEIEYLDAALSELSNHNPRWGEVVHLRYFLGLTIQQTAELLQVSPSTVKTDWQFARAWLKVRMNPS